MYATTHTTQGTRSYAAAWSHWLDDCRLIVQTVAGDALPPTSTKTSTSTSSGSYNLPLSLEQLTALRNPKLPLFLSGESLGGAHTIALGLMMQEEAAKAAAGDGGGGGEAAAVARRFSGACLVSLCFGSSVYSVAACCRTAVPSSA